MVQFDLTDPTFSMKDVIPEDKGAFLGQVLAFDNNKLAVVYKRNVWLPQSFRYSIYNDLVYLGQR